MNTIFQSVVRLARKPIVMVAIVVLAGGGFGYWYFVKRNQTSTPLITVTRGSISQDVTVTGNTKPEQSVDLAFEKGGKIVGVFADVGSMVSSGQALVKLDTSELMGSLADAGANVDAQNAKLAELKSGTRPEEIQIDEVKVTNAVSAFDDAKLGLIDKLNDSYTKSDDAIRNTVDEFFSNSRGSNPQLNFPGIDSQLKSNLEHSRFVLESTLVDWKASLNTLSAMSGLGVYADIAKKNLDTVKSFLDMIAFAINALTLSASTPQATIDTYKADVASARTNINTATVNLSGAVEKWRSVDADVTLAQNELSLAKAGTVSEQLTAQVAVVKQAEAKLETIQAQIAKTTLYAPISGVVTKQDAKVGEIAAASVVLVSIISQNKFEVDANVPEVDIGKIHVGDVVLIAFDAFSGESFSGKVGYVDPAETIIDGVVNFKIKIFFEKEDPRFKSGLTTNLSIHTLVKNNVLLLPQYAVIETDQGTFVKKSTGGVVTQVPVETGIRGIDGNLEIVSGLGEGDQVVNVGLKTNSQ